MLSIYILWMYFPKPEHKSLFIRSLIFKNNTNWFMYSACGFHHPPAGGYDPALVRSCSRNQTQHLCDLQWRFLRLVSLFLQRCAFPTFFPTVLTFRIVCCSSQAFRGDSSVAPRAQHVPGDRLPEGQPGRVQGQPGHPHGLLEVSVTLASVPLLFR